MNTATTKKKPAAKAAKTEAPKAAEPAKQTKADLLISMLAAPEGTTIAEMSERTGWLPHSVRGFMAGTLKKKYQKAVVSSKEGDKRVYRIAPAEAAA